MASLLPPSTSCNWPNRNKDFRRSWPFPEKFHLRSEFDAQLVFAFFFGETLKQEMEEQVMAKCSSALWCSSAFQMLILVLWSELYDLVDRHQLQPKGWASILFSASSQPGGTHADLKWILRERVMGQGYHSGQKED